MYQYNYGILKKMKKEELINIIEKLQEIIINLCLELEDT